MATLAACFALAGARAALAAPAATVRLAPASPGSVRFTVTIPEPALAATGDADGGVRLDLEGYDLQGEPGTPGLPRRVVVVAVPPLGEVRLNAVASSVTTRDGVTLAPVPSSDPEGNERTLRRPEAWAAAGSETPVAARLLQVTWLRNQRIARISIEPAAYAPASRRLALAARVDVDVQVQPVGALGPPAEPDDPFEPLYRSTLANYAQGIAWRRPSTTAIVDAARRLGLRPDAAFASSPPETASVLYGHKWAKLAVRRSGFYSVNYSSLRNTALFGNSAAKFDSLRLFTLPGYPLLPEMTYCDTCALREVPIGTWDTNATGQADGDFGFNTDYFYFFAQGPSGWSNDFDPAFADTAYLNHPYELQNYYYLTVATDVAPVGGTPLRLAPPQVLAAPTGSETVATTVPERVRFEQDLEYWPDATAIFSTLTWEKWFWASMTPGGGFDFSFGLPGMDDTQPARMRLRQWGVTDNKAFYNANPCHGPSLDHYLDVSVNALAFPRRAWDSYTARRGGAQTLDTTGTFLTASANALHLRVPVVATPDCPGRIDRSALAWFEVYYQRFLRPLADTLEFHSPGATGPYRYDIGPFVGAAMPRLFDITNPIAPRELQVDPAQWTGSPGAMTLTFADTTSVTHHYRVFPDSVISIARLPASQIADAPVTSLTENLRSATQGADDVIIYYDGFQPAASALATARAQHLPLVGRTGPFLTKIVPVSALFDQFSGGRTDPAAIRNFLRAAFLNWRVRPKFVTLLGDASFDYKNIKALAPPGQPGCLLPTYENGFDENIIILRQFATDDWMLNVTDPTSFLPDFFGGRIPASDGATALSVVNGKIIAYENSAPLGEYRNSVLLMADDDVQGEVCDGIGWGHLQQTNDLNTSEIPLHEDREYVYLHTFPTGPGGTKPLARVELKKDLNAGVTLFNFVGHGSPFKITDESVFIDSDAGSLTNGNRLFAFIAASCDVGKFNDPTVLSLGERLMLATNGGAIAVISATERALSGENANLNRFMYRQIFQRGDLPVNGDTLVSNGQYHVPLSAALLAGKISAPGTGPINNTKYQLMGDPATTLNLPRLWTNLTLTDGAGAALTSLQRGQTVTFHGTVLDHPGGSAIPYDGLASVLIEDSAPTGNTFGNPYDIGCWAHSVAQPYLFSAGPMYHGNVSVANGVFAGRFVVPMDANIGTEGRVRAYVQGRSPADAKDSDGTGSVKVPVITGTAGTSDTEGPRITLSFVGGSSAVRPDATLQIDLFDVSGIMTTGHALINSIVVTVDDNTTSRTDVTETFRYAADSYQAGAASFVLPGLSAGHHHIKVSAADNLATGITAAQHRASATIEFDVFEVPKLDITSAYLFPNPMHSSGGAAGGTFIVNAPGDRVNVLVRVFTISGKLVRTLKRYGGQGQVQLPWDGLDAEGSALANGTYLFKVYANGLQTDGSPDPRQHADAQGRIVVLNR